MNDARAMGRALRELGFEVLLRENAGEKDYVAPQVEGRARAENVAQRPQLRGAIPGDVPLVRLDR